MNVLSLIHISESPQGYRLRRHALWQTITSTPQAESDGRTPLAAFPVDMMEMCIRDSIQGGRYPLIRRLTIKHVLCGGLVVLTVFYLFYLLRLDSQTQDILHQLNKLLR